MHSWQDIIHSDVDKITLIGYGSLLNCNTHHSKHTLTPVIAHGFKRIYNLSTIIENPTPEQFVFFRKYMKKYGIKKKRAYKKSLKKDMCVLNCIKSDDKEHFITGLAINIERKDFQNYATREFSYNLIPTTYSIICPKSGKIEETDKVAYILSGKETSLSHTGKPFLPYHNNNRRGAYKVGKYFGQLYDKSTYDNKHRLITHK